MILPLALLQPDKVYLGYGYDLPLGLVNLTILLLIVLLLQTLKRSRTLGQTTNLSNALQW